MLYLLWDEGPNSDLRGSGLQAGGGRVPLIAAGRLARKGGRVAVPANHYALLRTIEANLGVPALRNAGLPSTPLLGDMLRLQREGHAQLATAHTATPGSS